MRKDVPQAPFIQSSFTAGEVSPRLLARVDFAKFQNGVQLMENYLPLPHGGATSRNGTRFVSEVKDSAKDCVLVPFEFSTVQAYMLEFGDQYVRFYKDYGRIESPPGTPVEVATPYLEADLATLKFAQSADTLYIAHRSYAPRKLTRTSHTAWTLSTVDFLDGPYLDENLTAPGTAPNTTLTITPSAATGAVTLTASANLFVATDVGRYVRMLEGTVWGYAKITGYISATQVNATVVNTLTNVNAKSKWRLGAWGNTLGYPGAITIFEQRLVVASTNSQPQTIWGSNSASYEDFTPGTGDSFSYTFTLGSNKVNVIRWLMGTTKLIAGTMGEEFTLSAPNEAALSPTNVKSRSETPHGSKDIQGVRVGSATLFVQRSGKKLRQLSFNQDQGGFTSPDVTLLSEHITGDGVTGLAYQQEPDSLVWNVRTDGVLASCTFLPIQDVIAWARHTTDGQFRRVAVIPSPDATTDITCTIVQRTINGTAKRYIEYFDPAINVDCGLSYDGVITSATLTPAATTGTGVNFTASVGTFVAGDVGKDIVFADESITARATITSYVSATVVQATIVNDFPSTSSIAAGEWGLAVQTLSGLGHLEGKTVKIVGDGAVYPDEVVSGGAITLDGMKALLIDVGLGFTPKLKTLEPNIKNGDGDTLLGVAKRFAQVYVRVYETTGVWINGVLEEPSRSTADTMGRAPAPYTGDVKATNLGYEDKACLTIEQRNPLKSTILAIWGTLDYGEL